MAAERPIYLDYQASTPMDPRVLDVVLAVMRDDFGNPSSETHALGWRAHSLVEEARASAAGAIGALPEEVIFTSGATEADNLGVLGAALAAPATRRRILVSAIEHHAVLEAAEASRAHGFAVEMISVTPQGLVDLDDLRAHLAEDVAVVSVMAVNNEIGTIQPVAEVAQLAAAAGAFMHSDATQAPAAMDVDVAAWGVDAVSLSSHKVYGPKGVGAMYLSAVAPWKPRPLQFGGGQEGGMRSGTVPAPLCAGFGVALDLCRREGIQDRLRVAAMRDRFAAALKSVCPELAITAEDAPRHPGNLHVRFPGWDGADFLARVQSGVCAATGSACTSGVIGPSHVLLALGLDPQVAAEGVRFSLGRFTSSAEIAKAVEVIAEVLGRAGTRAA